VPQVKGQRDICTLDYFRYTLTAFTACKDASTGVLFTFKKSRTLCMRTNIRQAPFHHILINPTFIYVNLAFYKHVSHISGDPYFSYINIVFINMFPMILVIQFHLYSVSIRST